MRRLLTLGLEQIGNDLCLVFTADDRKGRGIIGIVDLATMTLITAELAAAFEFSPQPKLIQ